MTGYRETAIRFGDGLVGVVAAPTDGPPRGVGVVLTNAGLIDRTGAHRVNVEAARRFAAAGFWSIRFDLSGIGDSAPRRDRTPFAESMVLETREAMDALAAAGGPDRFVPMGLCSGADQSFQTACADTRVVGAVWIDGYPYLTRGYRWHRLLRPLTRPDTWRRAVSGELGLVSRLRTRATAGSAGDGEVDAGLAVRDIPPRDEALAAIQSMLARGVRLCVVYTAGQLGSYNHAGQFGEMYPELRGADGLDYRYFAHADHTFTQRNAREALLAHVLAWLADPSRGPA